MHPIVTLITDIPTVLEIWQGPKGIAVVADADVHPEVLRRCTPAFDDPVRVFETVEEIADGFNEDCLFARSTMAKGASGGTWDGATPESAASKRQAPIKPGVGSPSTWPTPQSAFGRPSDMGPTKGRGGAADTIPLVEEHDGPDNALVWSIRARDNNAVAALKGPIEQEGKRRRRAIVYMPEWLLPPPGVAKLIGQDRERAIYVRDVYQRLPGVRGIYVNVQSPSMFSVWLDPNGMQSFNVVREADPHDGKEYTFRIVVLGPTQSLASALPIGVWAMIANPLSAIHGRCRWCEAEIEPDMYQQPCTGCGANNLPTVSIKTRDKMWARIDVYMNPDATAYIEACAADKDGDANLLSQTIRWTLPVGRVTDFLPFGRREFGGLTPEEVTHDKVETPLETLTRTTGSLRPPSVEGWRGPSMPTFDPKNFKGGRPGAGPDPSRLASMRARFDPTGESEAVQIPPEIAREGFFGRNAVMTRGHLRRSLKELDPMAGNAFPATVVWLKVEGAK